MEVEVEEVWWYWRYVQDFCLERLVEGLMNVCEVKNGNHWLAKKVWEPVRELSVEMSECELKWTNEVGQYAEYQVLYDLIIYESHTQ